MTQPQPIHSPLSQQWHKLEEMAAAIDAKIMRIALLSAELAQYPKPRLFGARFIKVMPSHNEKDALIADLQSIHASLLTELAGVTEHLDTSLAGGLRYKNTRMKDGKNKIQVAQIHDPRVAQWPYLTHLQEQESMVADCLKQCHSSVFTTEQRFSPKFQKDLLTDWRSADLEAQEAREEEIANAALKTTVRSALNDHWDEIEAGFDALDQQPDNALDPAA